MNFHTGCLVVVTGVWSLEKLIWLGRVISNRIRRFDELVVAPAQGNGTSEMTAIEIRSQRPRKVSYGQYIFIATPSIPHSITGSFQAHPYMIAWEHSDGSCQILTLLIAHCAGFSRMIPLCKSGTRMRLDGPYGGTKALQHFDKVLFIASGIGIAAHLLAIRHLVQAHNDKTSRVRRLSLLWFLETDGKTIARYIEKTRQMLTTSRTRSLGSKVPVRAHEARQ